MWEILTKDPKALALAILAHLALLGILVFSLDWTPKLEIGGKPRPEAIKAVAVDDTKIQEEIKRQEALEKQKETEAEERLKKIEEQTRQAEAARKKEEQRLAEIKKKEAAEKKRQAEIKRKKEAEAKRLAEEKKKKELERKKREEEKRKAEAEKKRKAAEAKRKAEEEKKRIAAEKALQEQLAAERAALDAARERANQSVVAEYTSAIKQKVQRNWIRPSATSSGLSCEVRVTLIPGGDVASVRVVKSSGDAVFDRSVEAAVRRAAPLPLPPDSALFDRFRDLQFLFKPT